MRRLGLGGSSCAYVTVGTGIGVGLVVNGAPVHGLMHPEGGHLCVPRLASDATYPGSNPDDCFGGSCAENMACSVSLAKRAGLPDTSGLAKLPDDHPAWEAAAHYLGAMCANLVLLVSPERIVLSGGVMQRAMLFPKVRKAMQANLNGYIQLPAVLDPGVDNFIVPSSHSNKAGMVGAMTLAVEALKRKRGGASGGASGAAPCCPQRRGPKLPWLLGGGAAGWTPASPPPPPGRSASCSAARCASCSLRCALCVPVRCLAALPARPARSGVRGRPAGSRRG